MKIGKKVLKDGSMEITVIFTALARSKAVQSGSGKMLLGYSSGFKAVPNGDGDKINICYGWNTATPSTTKPNGEVLEVIE
jgi:hypothetical protein